MTPEQVEQARQRFLGSRLWQQLDGVEDSADARVVVDVENGYTLGLTLGDLRALKADLEANTPALREVAQEYLNLWDDGADFTNPVCRKLARAFRDALG